MSTYWLRVLSTGLSAMACLLATELARAATVVACVVDSITAGACPSKLGTLLGNTYTTNNYGVSGTTLLKKGDFPCWNTQQFTDSHTANPNIVIIILGTNDSKPQNWGTHSGEYTTDYEALIDSYNALASKPRIFLNLPPPAGTNGYGISGTIIENEILPLVRQTATKKGTGLIDIFSAFGGHNFDPTLYGSAGDQVHPGDKGAQRIADTVFAAITAPADAGAGDAATTRDAAAPKDAAMPKDAPAPIEAATGGAGGSNGASGGAAQRGLRPLREPVGRLRSRDRAGRAGRPMSRALRPPTTADAAVESQPRRVIDGGCGPSRSWWASERDVAAPAAFADGSKRLPGWRLRGLLYIAGRACYSAKATARDASRPPGARPR